MELERWLEELRQELGRQRMPRRYIKRLVGELSDHFTDFMEDSMNKDVQESMCVIDRLGQPDQLAENAAKQYRRTRFSARHPWLAFAALPPLLLPLLWAGFALGAWGLAWVLDELGVPDPPFPLLGKLVIAVGFYAVFEVPIALCAIAVCRAARKSELGWQWPVLACFILSIVSIQVCPIVWTSETND